MAGWRRVSLLLALFLLAGCSADPKEQAVLLQGVPTTASTTTSTSTTTTTSTSTSTTTATTTTTSTVPGRPVTQQNYTPFASAGGVVLRHPANRVERIGFHESTLDGAQQLQSLPTSAPWLIMDDRSRDTTAKGAADVMVDPDAEIRAPVSGIVRYAEPYILYCKYHDDFLIIEPDDHPGWEVKMLHINGLQVKVGQRVTAGVTVVASHATRLPFESQVEEGSYRPAWPHVHVEIDDPNVPDRPTGPGCP